MNEWFNLVDYTISEQIIFALGCALWFVVYAVTIYSIYKNKFCEIPAWVVCANISWEFLKSFIFLTDMGKFYNIAYAGWFFLDLYILYGAYRYGDKLVFTPAIKKYFKLILSFNFISWFAILYFMMYLKYDDVVGALSAFVINIVISVLYNYVILNVDSKYLNNFSYTVAWTKMFGTAFVGVFAAIHWQGNYLLVSLGVIIFILDLCYTLLLYKKRRKNK